MANFKALSSGFVFGSVLLLLLASTLVGINVYHAAAASCSNSSEAMLFKSSPLKVVEEVAKDQRTTTEIAIDDHHEIQAGRVLQGVGGQVWKLVDKFRIPLKGAKTAYKSYNNLNTNSNDLNNYLDSNYCVLPYCYPSTQPDYCLCQEKEDQTRPRCINLIPEFYCCKGSTDGTCSDCCVGKDGTRDILKVTTTSPSSTTPTGVSSISSSQSPIAYVAIAAVIASVILV